MFQELNVQDSLFMTNEFELYSKYTLYTIQSLADISFPKFWFGIFMFQKLERRKQMEGVLELRRDGWSKERGPERWRDQGKYGIWRGAGVT